MTRLFSGRRPKVVAATAGLFAACVVVTAAALSDEADLWVSLDGSSNTFDIQTAGSADEGWQPSAGDWRQGNPDAYEVDLGDGDGAPLPPGGSLFATVAVRNASPTLAGTIGLQLVDPDPQGLAVDPATGAYLELFDQLRFTVADASHVIAADVTAEEFNALDFAWHSAVAAGEHRALQVEISLPSEIDNRWMGAATTVQFAFAGENS